MNKQQFISTIRDGTDDKQLKIECCEYFIRNYPIKLKQQNPMNPFELIDFWTKLVNEDGSEFTIDGGSDLAIEKAFNGLVKNLKHLEDYGK